MDKEKCRLCLCTPYNPAGMSSSIMDDSFETILKSVFRFAVPTFDIVGGQKNDLPVLVCFQCSNTIRNFHYFSEHVKANQKKLQSISDKHRQVPKPREPLSDNWSIDELIQLIKHETEDDETTPITEGVSTHADSEEQNRRIYVNSSGSASKEEIYGTRIEPPTCVEKAELVGTLETMDKRVDVVTKQLSLLIKNLARSQRLTKKRRIDRQTSFDFSPVKNVEELDSLNEQLNDEEYRAKFQDWLVYSIDADDSENRMHQTLDLIFDRKFFPKCTWTGRSKTGIEKAALRNYTHVIKLFLRVGCTDTEIVSPRGLEEFLKRKLRHAKERVNIISSRTSCHKVPRKTLFD